MADLFETINQTLKDSATPLGARPSASLGPESGTAQARAQLAANTGKAFESTGSSEGRISSQQEIAVQQQAAQALKQQQQQSKALTTKVKSQAEALEGQAKTQSQALTQQWTATQEDFQTKAAALMQQLSHEGERVDFQQRQGEAQQMTQLMRLSAEKYVNQLQIEGVKSRLENSAAFQDAINRATFTDELAMMNSNLNFKRLVNANDREYKQRLAEIDVDMALEIAAMQAKTTSQQAQFSGLSSILSTGIQAGVTHQNQKALDSNIVSTKDGIGVNASGNPVLTDIDNTDLRQDNQGNYYNDDDERISDTEALDRILYGAP